MPIDHTTALCLACSASLPPRKFLSSNEVFTTNCCNRPICPKCLTSNPRLRRYDPCLACLAGVDVVSKSGARNAGEVRDEDTFMIGEDEDDEDEGPPPYEAAAAVENTNTRQITNESDKYYIRKGDTLHGIALRFGVDSRELCILNKLPISTLSTTPHILHTRGFVILPGNAQGSVGVSREEEAEREVKRARERAVKKLQMMTKEVDWRVAKAYVALAEDEDEQDVTKRKEMGKGKGRLEELAVERYLDDEEWEERERCRGYIKM